VHSRKVSAEWVEGGLKFLAKRRCEGIRVLCHIIHARAESIDVVANREEQPFECSANVVNSRVRLSKLFHYFVKVTKNLHLDGGSRNGGLGIGCRRYAHNCVIAKSSKPSIIRRDIGQSPGDIGGINVIGFLNIWWRDEGLGIPVLMLGVDSRTLTIIIREVVEWVGGSKWVSRGSCSNGNRCGVTFCPATTSW
jgi:hypothetical protein